MPKAGSKRWVSVTKANGGGNFIIELRVIDSIDISHGSGPIYQRRIIDFSNLLENEVRKSHKKTIVSSGSPNVTLEFEAIDEFALTHGSGPIYQKHICKVYNDPDVESLAATRKTHKVKVYHTQSSDAWIEVERIDEATLEHGRGSAFRREIIALDWDDEEFDAADVPLITEALENGVRLDPFQRIVDMSGGDPDDDPGSFDKELEYLTGYGSGVSGNYLVEQCFPADHPPMGIDISIGGTTVWSARTFSVAGGHEVEGEPGTHHVGTKVGTLTGFPHVVSEISLSAPSHSYFGPYGGEAIATGTSVTVIGKIAVLTNPVCALLGGVQVYPNRFWTIGELEEVHQITLDFSNAEFVSDDVPPFVYHVVRVEVVQNEILVFFKRTS